MARAISQSFFYSLKCFGKGFQKRIPLSALSFSVFGMIMHELYQYIIFGNIFLYYMFYVLSIFLIQICQVFAASSHQSFCCHCASFAIYFDRSWFYNMFCSCSLLARFCFGRVASTFFLIYRPRPSLKLRTIRSRHQPQRHVAEP